MDYEKMYKEALERAKSMIDDLRKGEDILAVSDLESMFPELADSEDERIRKAILTGLIDCRDAPDLGWSDFGGIPIDDCIAWLENQGKKFIPENIDEAALQYVDTCAVDGEVTHDNVTEPYWNNHSMMKAYKAGWLKQSEEKDPVVDFKAKDWHVSKVDGKIHNIYHSVDNVESKFKAGDWVTIKE